MSNKIEIRAVILARAIQVVKSPSGTVGYLPDVVEQIKARYQFLALPTREELVPKDPGQGAEFRHGRLIHESRVIVIDKFTVFNDGVVVDMASSTDDADLFLNDLQTWAKTEIPKATAIGPRYYLSHLELHTELPLEIYAPALQPIGEKITKMLGSYGIKTPRFEVTSIGLYFDLLGRIQPQPGGFNIDRRLNVPYAENLWFSQAPLKTADHVRLLKEMETLKNTGA
jgi:hypothetical protein